MNEIVSIPIWCDSNPAIMIFKNGTIKFQFLYGAIQTLQPAKTIWYWDVVSIPIWCDSNPLSINTIKRIE